MRKILLVIFLLTLRNVCFSTDESAYDKELSASCEISNFHFITPHVMRGGQPSREGLVMLKNHYNTKTVLDFRYRKFRIDQEKAVVEELGMNYINIPMIPTNMQSPEKIQRCLHIINNKANHPIFVHCVSGKDRTGLIFAAYRIKYDNWSLEDAFEEMVAYGHCRGSCIKLERSLIQWNKWKGARFECFEVKENYFWRDRHRLRWQVDKTFSDEKEINEWLKVESLDFFGESTKKVNK